MNKNIIVVGAIAVGLYLLSQGNKQKKAVSKKKAIYNKPKTKRVIVKKKAIYNKPKIKKAVSKKKAIYNKPITKRVIVKKKAIYNKPKIKKAVSKKKIAPTSTKPQKKKLNTKYHIAVHYPKRR